ncbi:MAG: hypothetical protein FWG55_03140 [Candidatus Bathyarchaeota archaeon]|nr:hypothetical protein [Candidatus Termiticorpusculum sp.]
MANYFNTYEVAAIALCSALWAVLNRLLSPVFFSMFGLPFLCDLIGFSVLIVAIWWIKKFGAITLIGLIATIITFTLGGGLHFLGFTVASIFFDLAIRLTGYNFSSKKPAFLVVKMMSVSIISAAIAGYLIGFFFMSSAALTNSGGIIGWAGLHAVGGVMGGIIGTFLIFALNKRKVVPNNVQLQRQ